MSHLTAVGVSEVEEEKHTTILDLPLETLQHVASYLEPRRLGKLRRAALTAREHGKRAKL
ncbi:hypothetical protein CLAFUW4_14642 [Fulvia fulva]|uniref:F-box domain-containing protein n=1 Tax=Passalora fulva TaxID=5499 RepID=A0A9Q8PM44_PASFU|nr:uncharacterized protein CLAFUR5_14469 [Fulvia fulva]KAK4609371.1 hypothetical protein CLAFUR4_14636 [Fulvia fulva]KAK4609549.1 hypothetical protein CLAFUR0_14635 [Fulvia fulva]UJO24993.1 hypothetical protein CLAFUR5_14469 [Fulvia fulva]WPV22682.1 hypothetical protein CLAFUW4_14642 [Fulvia fulva]WPV37767.1 hypothetical protein CLAFUW7_14645 [Fulvia fulva]